MVVYSVFARAVWLCDVEKWIQKKFEVHHRFRYNKCIISFMNFDKFFYWTTYLSVEVCRYVVEWVDDKRFFFVFLNEITTKCNRIFDVFQWVYIDCLCKSCKQNKLTNFIEKIVDSTGIIMKFKFTALYFNESLFNYSIRDK